MSQFVIRNGNQIEALNSTSVQTILAGMLVLTAAHNNQLVKGLKVTGDGTYMPAAPSPKDASKTIPAKFIYNIAARSEVALGQKKAADAYAAAMAAEAAGDVEKQHDSWRDFINACTVSFNVIARGDAPFSKGQLVQGVVEVVTTENGQSIQLRDVCAQAAVTASKKQFSLAELFAPKA